MGAMENPFFAGPGYEPPHLAGREEQREAISEALQLIVGPRVEGRLKRSPPTPIKIVGPRRMGKTALFHLARDEARRQGIHVVYNLFLSKVNPSSYIIRSLLEGMDLRERIPLWLSSLLNPGVAAQRGDYVFKLVLKARLRRQPVLLLLDDAMRYDTESFGSLLQVCQQMIKGNFPLAVMIAGAPALDGKLAQTKAGFMNRCREMYIDQLSDEEVCAALRKPLQDNGVKVADEALDLMASWTDNYPYFVQLAGKAVWEAMRKAKRNEVDLALAQGAEAAMQKERLIYYHGVFEKISDADALAYASQVVAIVEAADPPLTRVRVVAELAAANDGMSKEEARKIFNLLLDSSMIWFTNDAEVRAAIPSFFQYFKQEYELGT